MPPIFLRPNLPPPKDRIDKVLTYAVVVLLAAGGLFRLVGAIYLLIRDS